MENEYRICIPKNRIICTDFCIIVHKCTENILVSTVTCFDMFLVPWKSFLNVPFALSKQ